MKFKIISTLKQLIAIRAHFAKSQKIGFVPTMGYLHEGHLSLVRKAKIENDIVIVSIFVNPTQFSPKDDLSRYPRNLARDVNLLKNLDVDIVFTPTTEEIYPKGFQTFVDPIGQLVNEVEGAIRPGHFRGVATVVLKLFSVIQPTNVYFGQKDAQQVLVVANMIRDFNLPIKLRSLPTIREKDGLAMSSRNAYLTGKERKTASILYKTLLTGKEVSQTTNQVEHIKKAMEKTFAKDPKVELDYIEIRHAATFEKLTTVESPALFLVAAKIGSTRLIDNFVLQEDNTWDTGIKL